MNGIINALELDTSPHSWTWSSFLLAMSYLASSSPVGVLLLPSGVHLYRLFAYAVAYHHVTSTTSTPTPSYIYLLAPSSLPIHTHFLRIVFTSISITDSILLSICRHIMSVKHSKLESPWKAVQNFKLGSIVRCLAIQRLEHLDIQCIKDALSNIT